VRREGLGNVGASTLGESVRLVWSAGACSRFYGVGRCARPIGWAARLPSQKRRRAAALQNVGAPTFLFWCFNPTRQGGAFVGASLEADQQGRCAVLACRAKARRPHGVPLPRRLRENVGAPTFPFWNCEGGVGR
jgi:hypothetical protein